MFDPTLLILLALAALGFVSHNTTVAISILVLIIVRVTPLNTFFPWIEKQGLTIGIIILTIGVMAPIASGTLPASTLLHSFVNWKSLVAIAVGVFVSWLGGRGVTLMSSQPSLVAGLLVGTVLGVALFRGVPVGPLIAAGLVSLFIGSRSQAGDIAGGRLSQSFFEHGDKGGGGVIPQRLRRLLDRLSADQKLQCDNQLELVSPAAKA